MVTKISTQSISAIPITHENKPSKSVLKNSTPLAPEFGEMAFLIADMASHDEHSFEFNPVDVANLKKGGTTIDDNIPSRSIEHGYEKAADYFLRNPLALVRLIGQPLSPLLEIAETTSRPEIFDSGSFQTPNTQLAFEQREYFAQIMATDVFKQNKNTFISNLQNKQNHLKSEVTIKADQLTEIDNQLTSSEFHQLVKDARSFDGAVINNAMDALHLLGSHA